MKRVEIAKGILEEAEALSYSWSGFRKFAIQRKVDEGGGVCSFYLTPHDRNPLASFKPGQFLTFNLHIRGSGRDAGKEVIRCYSLSDSPGHSDYYRISIKRVPPPRDKPDVPPGVASAYFHDELKEGDIVDVKAPAGSFCLDTTQQSPVVLIGGGVGVTPVLSMLNSIAESESKRETWFFLGIRCGEDHIFREHFRAIELERENTHLHVCYSDPTEKDEEWGNYDHAERVSVEMFKKLLPSNNYDFYICGPPPMMDSIVKDLKGWGVPDGRIHFEAFGPASVNKKPAAPEEAKEVEKIEEKAGPQIAVQFSKSGKSLEWSPSEGSLLDFALKNGVVIDSGCRTGNCGTCVTAIKSGEVAYFQEPGTMPEQGSCLVCISHPKGPLTLDA
jgi:hypothetical protein